MGRAVHQPFESKTASGVFTKICDDMMESAAWQALSRSQRCLCFELKKKYRAKYSNKRFVSDNANDITMPKSEALKLYGELRTFRQDIDKLIDCGFINLVSSGYNTREVNIFGFSDRWKKYGNADYKVPPAVKRPKRKPLADS